MYGKFQEAFVFWETDGLLVLLSVKEFCDPWIEDVLSCLIASVCLYMLARGFVIQFIDLIGSSEDRLCLERISCGTTITP